MTNEPGEQLRPAGNLARIDASVPLVVISAIDTGTRTLWNSALDLAEELPERGWALVGGLMVQLHAYRHGQAGVRPTQDIDILGNSREQPKSLTELIAERLLEIGYEIAQHTRLVDPPTVYRFERGGDIVDVLGPDGMKNLPPRTVGPNETIQVPAGTQALARTEVIEVHIDGERSGPAMP